MGLYKIWVGRFTCASLRYYRPFIEELEQRTVLSFFPPVAYSPTSAGTLAVGDFDGDGTPDLALTGYNGYGVDIWLGNGDGTFRHSGYYSTGPYTGAVAVGDFNGDGIPGLAVLHGDYMSGAVTILLGNGDGTFRYGPMTLPTTASPDALAVGDFAGDGHDDLAVVNAVTPPYSTGTVTIWMGVGPGLFNAGGTYDCGTYANEIAIADFNGDGVPDLAVANGDFDGGVTVLLGNGDGSFQPARTYPLPPIAYSVAVGDFTGNGIPDLAVTSFGSIANNYNDGSVSVLLGAGDGTFQLAGTYVVGALAESVAVADFTRSGNLDLAVENETDRSNLNGRVSLLLGNGDGTFQDPQNYNVSRYTYKLIAGDFNRDSFPDLAVTSGLDTFSILINAADWGHATSFTLSGVPPSVFAGTPFDVTVTARDPHNNVVIRYTGTIHFTSTDSAATLPADYTFTTNDRGVHTFTDVILRTVGPRFVIAYDTADTTVVGVSPLIDVLAPPSTPPLIAPARVPLASHQRALQAPAHSRLQLDPLAGESIVGNPPVSLPFAPITARVPTTLIGPAAVPTLEFQALEPNSTPTPTAMLAPKQALHGMFAWWGDLGLDVLTLDLLK
jgi:hypothetical protein